MSWNSILRPASGIWNLSGSYGKGMFDSLANISKMRLIWTTNLNFSDKKGPENDDQNKNKSQIESSKQSSSDSSDMDFADHFSLDELETYAAKERIERFNKYMETNSYYEKYKARLVAAQKTSPKKFLAMVENVIPLKKKEKHLPERLRTPNSGRKLSEIMKLDLLLELPKDEISFIWKEYHKSIKSVGAVMSGRLYEDAAKLGKEYRVFVLPLPKNGGFEFYLLQFGGEAFFFTQLVKFHMHKENAPVCLTLNFYKELLSTKDIVLLRGEYDTETLALEEAQHLTVQFNYYYAEGNAQRLGLLKLFNEEPSAFDHALVIDELKTLSQEHGDKFPNLGNTSSLSTN